MTDVLIADVEEYAERVAGGLGKKIEAFAQDVGTIAEEDYIIVLPYLKAGISLLFSQVGQAAIKAEIAALPAEGAALATGNVGVALITAGTTAAAAIASAVNANAGADAALEINDAEANGVTAATLEAPVIATITAQ